MTVSTISNSTVLTANGVTTVFPYSFLVFDADHLVVQRRVTTTGVIDKTYTAGEISVTGVGTSSGSVTISPAPASGNEIVIQRIVPYTQELDLVNQSGFYPATVEEQLDLMVMQTQQIASEVSRAFTLPVGSSGIDVGLITEGQVLGLVDGELIGVDTNDAAVLPALAAAAGVDLVGGAAKAVATRTALAAFTTAADKDRPILLTEAGREGWFKWDASDLSAIVAIDTLQGIYVAPTSAPTGASGAWVRQYNGFPRAEWFGAALDNGAVDSGAALQACIDVTGKLYFPKGLYYGTTGLNGNGAVIRGEGPLLSGYACSSATAHLLSNAGTVSAFSTGGDFEGFALSRTVTPTTPASAADDRTQGHGLHFDLVSNPRVDNVFTYNNLVEVYVARTLSAQIENIRGLRQTGTAADRWTGLYVYGDPTGMPGGWASGPSGNPSCTIKKMQMAPFATITSSISFSLQENLQDLWIVDPEASGCGTQFDINPNGKACGDVHIVRPIADGFNTRGFHIRNVPQGSSLEITGAWFAPASGATGQGARFEVAHGVTFDGRGDFTLAPTLDGVYATDSSQIDVNVRTTNCQRPIYTISVNSSKLHADGFCNLTATDAGYLVNSVGGGNNEISASGNVSGTKQWLFGIELDATAANCIVNVSRVPASAVSGNKYSVAGVAVTTQGNVSGHVIINPGAGAML